MNACSALRRALHRGVLSGGLARSGPGLGASASRSWMVGSARCASTSTGAPPVPFEPPVGAPFPAMPSVDVDAAVLSGGSYAGSYALQVAPDSWYVTHRMMEVINSVHTYGGLEWWQTIFALTIGIRIASFPMTLYSLRNSAALARIKPESDRIMEAAKTLDVQTGEGQRRHATMRRDLFKLYSDNKCSPFYNLIPILLQLPVFVFMFSALQAMSSHKTGHPWIGFETGGVSWFVDLSIPDPYFLLPIAASGTFLVTTLLQDPTMVASQDQARQMQYIGVGMSVFFLPVMATTSSATVLYFAATNLVGVGQTALLRSKTFRSLVSLPIAPPASLASTLPEAVRDVEYFVAAGAGVSPPQLSQIAVASAAASEREQQRHRLVRPPPLNKRRQKQGPAGETTRSP